MVAGACGPKGPQYNTAGNSSRSSLGGVDSGPASTFADGGPLREDGGIPDGGTLPAADCLDGGVGDTDGKAGTVPNLVISELYFSSPSYIEFYNRGAGSIDPAAVSFEAQPSLGEDIPSTSLLAGNYVLAAMDAPQDNGEAALLDSTGKPTFYVCWGTIVTSSLQEMAIQALVWPGPGCVNKPLQGLSLHLRGLGTSPNDWVGGSPTPLGCAFTP